MKGKYGSESKQEIKLFFQSEREEILKNLRNTH